MLGSRRSLAVSHHAYGIELFTVELAGRTLWWWEQRDPDGDLIDRAETLFADYVSCLCDARHT